MAKVIKAVSFNHRPTDSPKDGKPRARQRFYVLMTQYRVASYPPDDEKPSNDNDLVESGVLDVPQYGFRYIGDDGKPTKSILNAIVFPDVQSSRTFLWWLHKRYEHYVTMQLPPTDVASNAIHKLRKLAKAAFDLKYNTPVEIIHDKFIDVGMDWEAQTLMEWTEELKRLTDTQDTQGNK